MKHWTNICIILLSLSMISGCSNQSAIDWQKDANLIDNIKVEINSKNETDEGVSYDLLIHNGTNYDILQMKIALSYPIIIEKGHKSNKVQVEADHVLDVLKSGSYSEVHVFIPSEYGDGNYWDPLNPEIHMDGYFEQLSDANKFWTSGGLEVYLKDK